jgi:hypothetical protein
MMRNADGHLRRLPGSQPRPSDHGCSLHDSGNSGRTICRRTASRCHSTSVANCLATSRSASN